jgi:hypothetical protein
LFILEIKQCTIAGAFVESRTSAFPRRSAHRCAAACPGTQNNCGDVVMAGSASQQAMERSGDPCRSDAAWAPSADMLQLAAALSGKWRRSGAGMLTPRHERAIGPITRCGQRG